MAAQKRLSLRLTKLERLVEKQGKEIKKLISKGSEEEAESKKIKSKGALQLPIGTKARAQLSQPEQQNAAFIRVTFISRLIFFF